MAQIASHPGQGPAAPKQQCATKMCRAFTVPFMRDLGLGLELRRKSRTGFGYSLAHEGEDSAAWSLMSNPQTLILT